MAQNSAVSKPPHVSSSPTPPTCNRMLVKMSLLGYYFISCFLFFGHLSIRINSHPVNFHFLSQSFIAFKMAIFVPENGHLRGSLLFCFLLKENSAESQRMLKEAYGDHALSEKTCEEWYDSLKMATLM